MQHVLVTTSHSVLLLDLSGGRHWPIHRGDGLYYGITAQDGNIFVAARRRMVSSDKPGSEEQGHILVFDGDLKPVDAITAPFALRDMHEIAWHHGKLWVTCSFDNMVAMFDGRTWTPWYPLGEPTEARRDVNHFNSFHFEGGTVCVLAHDWGPSTLHFFDAASLLATRSIPLGVQAHNVWREGEQLFTCSSGEGCIRGTEGFQVATGGFPRGVARDRATRLVGISELKERSERDLSTGLVQVYDGDWRLRDTLAFDGEGLVLDILDLEASRPEPAR